MTRAAPDHPLVMHTDPIKHSFDLILNRTCVLCKGGCTVLTQGIADEYNGEASERLAIGAHNHLCGSTR